MMRRLLLAALLCGLLMLGGCTSDPIAPMASQPGNAEIPAPAAASLPSEAHSATLWFRFGTEPCLAPESRRLSTDPGSSLALSVMEALLSGPSAASTELNGLFPVGTRVLSVHQADRLMFVTLSRHIMNSHADEPASWRSDPFWAIEVPLRRQLAMQAIAATLTENCDVDAVIILVEQTASATDSLRLRNSYYALTDDADVAPPLTRDESLLLTPARTAEIILQCWQEADWRRLYQYTARTDPHTGAMRPEEDAFIARMQELPRLLHARPAGGSISMDGQKAVFTVSGAWLVSGSEVPFSGMTLRLVRERGIWRTGFSQLTEREALP